MKKWNVNRRLTLHFTYQMLLLFIFVLLSVLVALAILTQMIMNEDMKRRFPVGALEVITLETYISERQITVPDIWTKQLEEQQLWLQIVDAKGKVIHSINTPDDLKQSYEPGELLNIQQTQKYGPYDVWMTLDDMESNEKAILFMLGYMNEGAIALQQIYEQYAQDGVMKKNLLEQLDAALTEKNRTLQIMDHNGGIVHSFGLPMQRTAYAPLELLLMDEMRGSYPTNVAVYEDPDTQQYWVLHDMKKGKYVKQPLMKSIITGIIWLSAVVLLTTLVFSIYHGYRYGRPLLLFIDWFGRLGKGQYDATISEKDRKRLYRKNGKLKRKYKLYKEVIAGFSEMTGKLHASEQERIRLEKTREEWMTGISHDLRTPLSSIQGYGHLLESGQYSFTEEELKEMGDTIREKSDYMIDLIQDFSLIFQLKNKQIPFDLEPIELQEFVRRILLNYVNDMTMDQTNFLYESEDESVPLHVLANGKWFTRMLDNVIMNAVKHNPAGTTITLSVRNLNNQAILAISDDGVGMDQETMLNLFERYYRGTNTEEQGGAGLGMSIAKSIVLAHQGTIDVDSDHNRGTTITIALPLLLAKSTNSNEIHRK